MRAKEFLSEDVKPKVASKLQFIKQKVDSGELTDPKTVDYIYKILQKPEIQSAINAYLGQVIDQDADVAAFQAKNNQTLGSIIRKLPVEKEQLDKFVKQWASGKGFVNVNLLKNGSKGSLHDLIPDPTAFVAFETFEKLRSQVTLHKKGTAGYGEFGLSMLSPMVSLKAPGDIEVNGQPIEVKGNDARLYADERTGIEEEVTDGEDTLQSDPNMQQPIPAPMPASSMGKKSKTSAQPVQVAPQQAPTKRGSAPGALNNVLTGLLTGDANTVQQATQAFTSRGRSDAAKIIKNIQKQGEQGIDTLKVEWWKSGFTAYQRAIKMPIMIIGFGQFLISDKAEDFVSWGCLPRSITNYGYMFGRKAGQSRETYPKIFVPGHNK